MSIETRTSSATQLRTGGCVCGAIRYELRREPLIVHCCHCTYCQRESGAAFAVNLLIEASAVRLLRGMPQSVMTPTHSGLGQKIARCPVCLVAVWSNYKLAADKIHFIRVGTLDYPDEITPDIHIYTLSRQRWLPLPEDARAVPEYYRVSDVWTTTSIARYKQAKSSEISDRIK